MVMRMVDYKNATMPSLLASGSRKRAVQQISLDGEMIKNWESASEAAIACGFARKSDGNKIGKSASLWEKQKERYVAHGYWWEFVCHELTLLPGEERIALHQLDDGDVIIGQPISFEELQTRSFSTSDLIVSNLGTVFDTFKKCFTNGYAHNSGYRVIHRKNKFYKVHRLVACAFHVEGCPRNLTKFNQLSNDSLEVDHINGDKSDNRASNLQVLSKSEHRRKTLKDIGRKPMCAKGRAVEQLDPSTLQVVHVWDSLTNVSRHYGRKLQDFQPGKGRVNYCGKCEGYLWRYRLDECFPDEIFIEVTLPDETVVEVSNNGRVKEKRTGKLWYGSQRPDGYYTVRYNGRGYKVHRLVAKAFLMHELSELESSGFTESNLEVDHIDGDNSNNCASNLHWTERREHMRKTGARQKKRKLEITQR
jgi:hypothetical protein